MQDKLVVVEGNTELCVLAPGASARVRLGPFDADRVVVVSPSDGGTLFVSTFLIGNRDRIVGGAMPASQLTEDIATVPRGAPVTIGLLNNGSVEKSVRVTAR